MWLSPSSASAGAIATSLLLLSAAAATRVDGGSNKLNEYLAVHPVPIKAAAAVPASGSTKANALAPELITAVLSECPSGCVDAGSSSSNWTVYPRLGRLAMCNQTMLLDFSLHTSLRKDETVRACTADSTAIAGHTTKDASCLPSGSVTQVHESLQLAFNKTATQATGGDLAAAAQQLAAAWSQRNSSACTDTTAFAYSNTAAFGLFAGAGVGDVPTVVLQEFLAKIKTPDFSGSAVVQLCAKDGRSSKYSFGIVASGGGDVRVVQDAVAAWASAECLITYDAAEDWRDITLSVPSLLSNGTAGNVTTTPSRNSTVPLKKVNKRAQCSTRQVVSGDSCGSLAAECGISGADFDKYNPGEGFCSKLTPGQHVCCSAGTLPDFRPKPNADGTCASHYVEKDENCAALGAANSLTNAEIESFNKNTWAWDGCNNLQAYQYICLSTGDPPMPAPIANAICGPQKPGSQQPASGVSLDSLNPCPLNACCNKFGQCGINQDFCTKSESATGAPGTSAPGTNGCISNCGMDVVVGSAPAASISIGYFEAFNRNRPCLNMVITAMDLTPYTHVHLSFGEVTRSWEVDVSGIQEQWELFLEQVGFNKILSLGGWSFSTEPATYSIFRDAVAPGNQDTFVANIVSFVTKYDLDGIDIDWEYPNAPDIPGIPAGTEADAANYLSFLKKLRAAMPSGKTVSFCAPASYWYLRGYPISEMAEVADYIVYMTYDLHGQWDYANKFAIDGCPEGNCLRSQVNITETLQSLAMITKAGVPSNKLAIGVASYGRSFEMTTEGCTGPMCTYTGGPSGAYPGPCTGTAGYISNAEIRAIADGTGSWQDSTGAVHHVNSYSSYFDQDSQSDVVVYEGTQWVGYMNDDTKQDRTELYKSLNMAGVIDWAVDLNGYEGAPISPGAAANIVYPPQSIWDTSDPLAACKPPCVVVLPPYPLTGAHTVTSWPALTTTLLSSNAADGHVYVKTTTIPVPSFAISEVNLQPLTLYATETDQYTINPMQSIMPPSFLWTLPPNHATFPATKPTPAASTPAMSTGNGVPMTTNSAVATSSDSDVPLAIIPLVTFFPTSVAVTIQPQPTFSVEYPKPPVPGGPLTLKSTSTTNPSSTKTGTSPTSTSDPDSDSGSGSDRRGTRDCSTFGCPGGRGTDVEGGSGGGGGGGGGCGKFSCDGGCGIFGCGGGCGVTGCIPSCPLGSCGGLGCLLPGGCGNTQGSGGGDSSNECETKVTVSACTYLVTSYSAWYLASSTTTTETDCATKTACNGMDTSFTTTPGVPECTLDPDVARAMDAEAADDKTRIDGTDIPKEYWPTNPAGYDGSKFTLTQFGLSETITVKKTTTTTSHSTTTKTVEVPKAASAKCDYSYEGLFMMFRVYKIDGWANDGGDSLKKEEKGCGAMTGWEFVESRTDWGTWAYFQLPVTMKAGCVERAIVSAGGPKLSCKDMGDDEWAKDSPRRRDTAPNTLPSDNSDRTPNFLPSNSTDKGDTTNPYTPMVWGDGDTVTLTATIDVLGTSTYTTEIYIATLVEPVSSTETNSLTTETRSLITGTMTSRSTRTATTTTGSTAPTTTGTVSTDGSCGGADGFICLGSEFGDCCSAYGYCGSSTGHCTAGCQSAFGTCEEGASNRVSPDGSCGGANEYVCAGSGFGDCCSAYGYCGSDSAHCTAGCQGAFGTCEEMSDPVSPDGSCGGADGYVCGGSGFGDCCSAYGYCGSLSDHCGTGCQGEFGTC